MEEYDEKELDTQITSDVFESQDFIQEEQVDNGGNEVLERRLHEYIKRHQLQDHISVYMSDFHTVQYTYHIDQDFIAGSLYKLPLAMLYYEKIYYGELSMNDMFLYESFHYEVGGMIPDLYEVGSYIDLHTLLEHMIIYSDNTAAHILFENLGGWIQFKTLCLKYTQHEVNDQFLTYHNVFNATFMMDTLTYLYQNKEVYAQLLEDMEVSNGFTFLSLYVDERIAQKYGMYDTALHAVGIVFCEKPYGIVVLTDLKDAGKEHIGRIHQICYEYLIYN